MTETMAKDDVLEKIKEVLCEALNIDMDDIHLESTLMGNLGAESIDFLDIVFRLEKKFNIKIPRGEFFPEHFFDYTQNIDFKTGRLTKKGLDEVRRIPFCDSSK